MKDRMALAMMEAAEKDGRVSCGGKGVGEGFVVPLWSRDLVDEISEGSTEKAMAMSRKLAHEESLFAGNPNGGNVVAASRVALRPGDDATVVTAMADSGIQYLSKELYSDLP